MELPSPINRLTTLLDASRLAHELIFGRHRRLVGRQPGGPSSELLAESARIATVAVPGVLGEAQRLCGKWSEQSVLDPSTADETLKEVAAAVDRAEPEVRALIERQRQIAEQLQLLIEDGGG